MSREDDRRIRSSRPSKAPIDPWKPIRVLREKERTSAGLVPALTVFLAGRECPFTCVFCDLWQHTLDQPTPPGAIPSQLRQALERFPLPEQATLKLYNASNYFDDKAVPPEDDQEILELAASFSRLVVESHPKLIGERCQRLARAYGGTLEVAIGVETIHPEAQPKLNKGASLGEIEAAIYRLRGAGADWRAFILLGAPYVPPREAVEWAVRSVRWSLRRGARHISVIPARGGPGEMQRLQANGDFHPVNLGQLEDVLDICLEDGIVCADLWDAEALSACSECGPQRLERLERLNRSGQPEQPITCIACRP